MAPVILNPAFWAICFYPDNRWQPADFDRWNTFLAMALRYAGDQA